MEYLILRLAEGSQMEEAEKWAAIHMEDGRRISLKVPSAMYDQGTSFKMMAHVDIISNTVLSIGVMPTLASDT